MSKEFCLGVVVGAIINITSALILVAMGSEPSVFPLALTNIVYFGSQGLWNWSVEKAKSEGLNYDYL